MSSGVRHSRALLLTLLAALALPSLLMTFEHGDNDHNGENDTDWHVSDA